MKSTNRFLVLVSAAALLSTMLLSTVGAGIALAGTYFSPSPISTTGTNTLNWTGQGTFEGELGSVECDENNTAYLLWIFTTDGGSVDGTPVLTINGTDDYDGVAHGGSWHFLTDFYDLDTVSAFVTFDTVTTGNGSYVLTISHGCPGEHAAIADIATEVHDGDHNDITGTEVPLGSVVHDSAWVTSDPTPADVPADSTVTFYFFVGLAPNSEDACAAAPELADDTVTVDVSALATPFQIEDALEQGPLGPGAYFYFAVFSSGDTDVLTNATSPCEPFTVAKGDLDIRTDIHDAAHAVVLSVPLGSVVHDTATLSGSVAGFDPDMTKVSFTSYLNGDCEGAGASVANTGTESTFVARSADSAALAAGDYSYSASFAGDDNYNAAGPATCEPLTVEKGDLDIRTDIHDSAHAIVLSVPVGGIVHDTATLSGAVAGFDPDLDEVSFTFWMNGACDGAGAPAANAVPESLYVARTVNSAPLAAGHYSYSASFAGDDNYNAVGPATCEPLSVFQPGKTMGFWGNKNGIARILANGGYAANAVNIGRGANIDTQAESLKVLPKTLNACGKGNPIIFSDQTVSADCSLASGINKSSLNTLAAQTLALGYNIKLVAGYDGQTISDLGCSPVGALTSSSTVGEAFAAAVALIDGSASGGTTTQAQIGAMNTLLGCLNAEA